MRLEFDYQKLFLIYIDNFTQRHILILKMIEDNPELDRSDLQRKIVEEILQGDKELLTIIQEDIMVTKGLITRNSKNYYLTELGKKFMKFIRE